MYRNQLIVFSILFNFFFFYSQDKDIIYEEWQLKIDTISNIDNAIKLDKEYVLKVSKENQIYILNNLSFRYEDKKQRDSAHYYANKALTYKKEFPKHPAIAEAYIAKATIYMRNQELKIAKINLDKARKVLHFNKTSVIWHTYYQQMGSLNDGLTKQELAIKYSDSAIHFSLQQKDTSLTANLYHNLGIQYFNQNKLEKAVENLLNAIEIKEKYNKNDASSSYYILAVMYNNNRMFEQANKYIKKSLIAATKEGNEEVIMRNYMILAKQFTAKKLAKKALNYNDSAMVYAKKMDMWNITTELLKNKGDIHFTLLKEEEKGLFFYEKAYDRLKLKDDRHFVQLPIIEKLITVAISKNNPKKAKQYLNEYDQILSTIKKLDFQQIFHRESGKYYDLVKDYKQANFHYRKSYKLYDSINKVQTKAKVAELEKKYDTKNKELEIANLNEENAVKEKQIAQSKFNQKILLFSIIGITLFLVFGLFTYSKIRKQKRELANTNKDLSELNAIKNRLFSIISHDLRGMIIPFQRAGKVIKHYADKGDIDKTIALSQELQNNSQKLSNTLDNLLNWSLQQMKNYNYNEEEISVKKELSEIIENYSYHAKIKKTKLILDIKQDEKIVFDKGAFHVIFRNLIGNAIKFTENGSIKLTGSRNLETLNFSLVDSGTGMSETELKKLFSFTDKNTSSGTQGEKGTGIGLKLVHKFIEIHNGTINVSSEKKIGTKFDLSFPVKQILNLSEQQTNTLTA